MLIDLHLLQYFLYRYIRDINNLFIKFTRQRIRRRRHIHRHIRIHMNFHRFKTRSMIKYNEQSIKYQTIK